MTHPLDIPEIRNHLGSFLDVHQIHSCILVCRSWRDTFTPILYRSCAILRIENRRPSLETLNKYAEHIRYLRYYGVMDVAFYSIQCSRLTSLEIRNSLIRAEQPPELLSTIVELIQRSSGTMERFTLIRQRNLPSVALWKSLSQCTRLSHIQMQHGSVLLQDMEAFWEACSKTDELILEGMGFAVDAGSPPTILLPETFPKLSSLKLVSIRGFNNQSQLTIMQRAPNLSTLHWQPDSRHSFPLAEYRQAISNKTFKRLKRLNISQCILDDQDIAMTIGATTEAKYLEFCQGNFSEKSYLSLMRNLSSTIRTLNIRECLSTTGAMVQGILSGCPSLRTFMANTIRGKDLVWFGSTGNLDNPEATEMIVLGKDWVCLRLRYLALNFDMSSEESIIDKCAPEGSARFQQQQQLEQEQAFRQLSRLTRLRRLDISDPLWHDGRGQSLKLKLKSRGGELDQLKTLKRLKWIQFRNTFQDMSENEFDWMIGHWSKLTGLHGIYHTDKSRQNELKEYWRIKLKREQRA